VLGGRRRDARTGRADFLLENSALVSSVRAAKSATDALHYMHDEHYDVVLLDIAMPGIDGLELARVVAQFSHPPAIVFVTAHEEHALAAFDVGGIRAICSSRSRHERLVTRCGSGNRRADDTRTTDRWRRSRSRSAR
jgi:two-component system response regulator LytT